MAANEEGRAVKAASIRWIVAGATFAARDKSRTVQLIAARAIRNCALDTTIRVFDKSEASFRVKEAVRRLARLRATEPSRHGTLPGLSPSGCWTCELPIQPRVA
jgi:hypothetical protein